jgi:hypothetical protein
MSSFVKYIEKAGVQCQCIMFGDSYLYNSIIQRKIFQQGIVGPQVSNSLQICRITDKELYSTAVTPSNKESPPGTEE